MSRPTRNKLGSVHKPLNESALVCAARQGDKNALQKLLEDNWDWLKGLVYNFVGNAEDMDEVLQNVCVLVLDKIGSVRQPERFKNWLATVARHAALAFRQQRRRKPIQLDELLAAERYLTSEEDVADHLARDEQCEQILDALKRLPEKYREAFIMKYMKDMTYADIAEILEIPVTTVQIRLVRARRMIYNRLTGKPTNKVPRT